MPEWSSFWNWAGWMCFGLPVLLMVCCMIETVASVVALTVLGWKHGIKSERKDDHP